MKSFRQCQEHTKSLAESVQYLDSQNLSKCSKLDIKGIQNIVDQFEHVAYGQVKEAVQCLDHWTDVEKSRSEDAWNNSSIELAASSLAHVRYFVIKTFAASLTGGLISMTTPLKSILLSLFKMLAFTWIQENFGDFLRHSGLKVILDFKY